MKKFAIRLSLATLLLGGLIGCGDADQEGARGLGGREQRGMGYHATDQEPGTGITRQRAGEGPITDMFTRDDRRGARGFGRDERRPATGLAGERGLTGQRDGQRRDGMAGAGGTGTGAGGMRGAQFGGAGGRGGMTGTGMHGAGGRDGMTGTGMHGAGGRNGMTGTGYGTGAGMRGDGMTGTGMHGAGGRNGMYGTGFGTGTGGRNDMYGAGYDTEEGMRGTAGRDGVHGTRNGTKGLGDTGINGRDNGRAGIVGNNRAGYVNDRGILRDKGTTGRAGIGGLGKTGRNLQDNRTGMGTDRVGQTERFGTTGQTDDQGTRGTRMNKFSYPAGYDGATVQRINTRLADVENVKDSRVIVDDDRILIGVDANGQDTQLIEQDVRRTVGNMVGDREVVVVTERDQYNQVRTADDRLRGGEAFEEVGATINEMFQDFGRAIQRPFERTR